MNQDTQHTLSITVIKMLFLWFSGVLATVTILTHVSQLVGLSFKTYAFICLSVTIPLSCWIVISFLQKIRSENHLHMDVNIVVMVLITGCTGSVLTLITHLPNADDYNYVPDAVYALENQDAPMGFEIHFFHSGEGPYVSYGMGTAMPYDYARGIMAYVLNVDYLTAYYLISAALAGFLIPLALFYLISHFSDTTRDALFGTVLTVCMILILRETIRTFGNFAFPRIFQGKAVLMSVGIPLFTAATFTFFRERSVATWLSLFAIAIAMVGASPSAIVLLPPLAFILGLSFVVVSRYKKDVLLTSLVYSTSLIYIVFYALFLLTFSVLDYGSSSHVNKIWPITFLGHAFLMLNPKLPLTPVFVVVTTVLCLYLTSGGHRRFMITWIVLITLFFLNPVVAQPLIKYVTTPNVYWRMFYLYPFLLNVGIIGAVLSSRSQKYISRNIQTGCATLLFIGSIVIYLLSFNYTPGSWGWPKYKLSLTALETARQIDAIAPVGAMLAPPEISRLMTMISGEYPQIVAGMPTNDSVLQWMSAYGREDEVEIRVKASEFVDGDITALNAFKTLLGNTDVKVIVIEKSIFETPAVNIILQAHDYINVEYIHGGNYAIIWR